nr:hypothetical protein [Allomuricauda sp.]
MQKTSRSIIALWSLAMAAPLLITAQEKGTPLETIHYDKIYSHCLDGNVKAALPLLEVNMGSLDSTDLEFKNQFEKRFKWETDTSDYLKTKSSRIHDLHVIFRDYWREALLHPDENFERSMGQNAISFLTSNYDAAKNLQISPNNLGQVLADYIREQGYHTTSQVGKTGNIYDLLVWNKQRDTTYTFKIQKEKLTVKVVFMQDFVTLGWEEYATLGKYYPGGWATEDVIYCVEDAYDLESENFRISYLAHEGRHFLDKQKFPELKSVDLEYRAKLSELSLAEESLFDLIAHFTSNANPESTNPHPLANYRVIHHLSILLFQNDFEENMSRWKAVSTKKLNKTAYSLFKRDTRLRMQHIN